MSEAPVHHRSDRLLRLRTVLGGVALSGVLLLALALLGGIGMGPAELSEPGARDDVGPLTATQPRLHHALLSDEDLAPAANPPATRGSARTPPPSRDPSPRGPVEAAPGRPGDLCRALFEDPAGVPRLWDMIPRQTSSRQTDPSGGGLLQQVLALFEEDQVSRAYARLRDTLAGCGRFRATLADGSLVTVVVEEVASRLESTRADDSFAIGLRIEGTRPLVGWWSLDRVGPVVSVLRHLESPTAAGAGDLSRLREAALAKVGRLVRSLPGAGDGGTPDPAEPSHRPASSDTTVAARVDAR